MKSFDIFFVSAFCAVVTVVSGFGLGEYRPKRQTEGVVPSDDECVKPHMWRNAHECCRLPRERIWGDIRGSLSMCFNRVKRERRVKRQDMSNDNEGEMTTTMAPEGSEDETTETEMPPTDSSPPFSSSPIPSPGKPHRRKPLSERVKHMFSSFYKVVKDTFDILWQTVVMITDHPHPPPNDGCFMECVFQDQGFLNSAGRVNKDALLRRLTLTLGRNEVWHNVAAAAVETCHQMDFGILPNNNTCQSGSAEIFRCVFKQIFFNCPNWPERSEYCTSLREYYQRCPNGAPPHMEEGHQSFSPGDRDMDNIPPNPPPPRYTQ